MIEKCFRIIDKCQEYLEKFIIKNFGHKWEKTDQEGYTLKCLVCGTCWAPDTNVDLGFSWRCFKLQLTQRLNHGKKEI